MNTMLTQLRELSHLYHIQVAYNDVEHRRRQASSEVLFAALKAMGAPITKFSDIPSAIKEKRQELWQNNIEPVHVAWNGNIPPVKLRLPQTLADKPFTVNISLENGDHSLHHFYGKDLPTITRDDVDGMTYLVKRFTLPMKLPLGYHQLTMELDRQVIHSFIIAAPGKTYSCNDRVSSKCWGAFVPLYALQTKDSWGGANYSDLETMATWVNGMGGKVVATLPLLATFFENDYDLSPYSPASRLFWNEIYIDIKRIEELESCIAARDMLYSDVFSENLAALLAAPCADYRLQMRIKRNILEQLSRYCFTDSPAQMEKCANFIKANPLVEDYAQFRAACEKRQVRWQAWDEPQKDGVLHMDDYDEETKRYHIYVQWLADEQLRKLSQKTSKNGMKLYFDLPLGVNPDSFDVWRERDAFISGVSAGAPPDSFFTKGQQWDLTPLSPDGIRKQGYRYYRACLHHNLKYADILRIDHIMAYHRLYVVPRGFEASNGVYIRYRPSEFYAVVSLESNRNKAIILGEDLGTVPSEVRIAMERHDLYRHYVIQYEITPAQGKPFPAVPDKVVASINTHDMPTFAGFWQGDDIQQRYELGLLDETGVKKEQENRQYLREIVIQFLRKAKFIKESQPDMREILGGILSFLSSSRAHIILVNLEDLWLETKPQNVPGTMGKNYNYCRKLFHPFENLSQLPEVLEMLNEVNRRREGKA